ncbi:MAG: alpha/beta fold hydrolase [Myxococcales bacterium]|nr:alpha/beta fold hydrolase [Myxococcales bacterium]
MFEQLGLLGLPFAWSHEISKWTREQLRRQEVFLEHTILKPPPKAAWSSPNKIAWELPSLRLRDFSEDPQSPEVPTLLINPQVNSSYICDYAPGQSLMTTLREQGLKRLYAVDWKSATLDRADETLDDALWALHSVIDRLGGRVRLIGLCQGGWMSLMLSALFPQKVESVVLAAAPIDFYASPGPINIMARYIYPMPFYETLVAMGGGVMRGELISTGFNNMRPFERYVLKYVDLYANIDDENYLERYRELDNWYALPQNIPGATYLRIVKELFKENRMVRGEMVCCDQPLDLKKVQCPVIMIAGAKDHITLPGQLFAAEKYVGTQDTYRFTADAGHVGVFMSKRALRDVWPDVVKVMQKTASTQPVAAQVLTEPPRFQA